MNVSLHKISCKIMLNRRILRIKAFKVLYSSVLSGNMSLAQAEAQLDQTNVDIDAFNEAKSNFYSVRDQILNRDKEPEVKENDAYMNFGDSFKQIMQLLSDFLYLFFGGAGFSDMLK